MSARNIGVLTMVMAVALLMTVGNWGISGGGEALAKKAGDPPALSAQCLEFLSTTGPGLFGVNFKCYVIAQGTNLDQSATLTDQFETETVTVRQSQLICTPANKEGDGAFFEACPEFHLKCYNVVPSAPPVNQVVNTLDQFEPESVLVEAAQYLCEGALKNP
jgi:hypothetical protein